MPPLLHRLAGHAVAGGTVEQELVTDAVDQSAAETLCTARLRSSLQVRKKIAIMGAAASATIGMPAIDALKRFEFWLCAG
ncbi:hypothetical protein [Stenotrophomonas maltophilia]|uniref:hypothetical protein n=1 Tax=Stenotrophomonas maltophilia TaxID=40324 RepID=UPI0012FD8525|nr:hypothetical protein [Stenotrophomonas maltophilia]